jgi:GT2 family glycosyltransferase
MYTHVERSKENKMPPKVSLIMLTWNNYQDTKKCLESLRKITYPNCKIIVVDNGSTDKSGERLKKEFPQYRFIRNDSNLGFAEGNNVGIRHALKRGADYVLLLNNDTIVDPGFLEPLVEIAETDDQIGVAGPMNYFYDAPKVIQSIGAGINLWKGSHSIIGIREVDKGQYNEPMEVDYVSGAALLVKRRMIEDIGLLDPDYFLYSEEVDWCYRAAKAGYKIMAVPESKIWHKVSSSTGGTKSPLSAYYMTRNRILFMRKHARIYHWPTFLSFFAMDILNGLLSCAKHRDIKRAKAMIKGILWHLGVKCDENHFLM